MDSNNISKDNSNGVTHPYMSAGGRISGYGTYQPGQLPGASNGNPSLAQPNSSFPRPSPPVPPPSFPYGASPQQAMSSLRTLPGGPSYHQYEPAEAPEDHAERPPAANGPLANSSLFQLLGSTYPRPAAGAPVETIQGQDQSAVQGQTTLSQLNSMAEFLAGKGDFANAINYYERIITVDPDNGAAWTALGHCYLLTDSLQKAFNSYQRALYSLPDVRDPQLWYGIGLLYEKVFTSFN